MEAKKTSRSNLENKRFIFREIGLVIALAVVFFAFETKFYQEETKEIIGKMKMYQQMLCILICFVPTELADYNGYYEQKKGGRMQEIYDFLCGFGFDLDEEYIPILDGSSELYEVKEEQS